MCVNGRAGCLDRPWTKMATDIGRWTTMCKENTELDLCNLCFFWLFSMFASAIDINDIGWYPKDDWCLTIGFSIFGFLSENVKHFTTSNIQPLFHHKQRGVLLVYSHFSITGRGGGTIYLCLLFVVCCL